MFFFFFLYGICIGLFFLYSNWLFFVYSWVFLQFNDDLLSLFKSKCKIFKIFLYIFCIKYYLFVWILFLYSFFILSILLIIKKILVFDFKTSWLILKKVCFLLMLFYFLGWFCTIFLLNWFILYRYYKYAKSVYIDYQPILVTFYDYLFFFLDTLFTFIAYKLLNRYVSMCVEILSFKFPNIQENQDNELVVFFFDGDRVYNTILAFLVLILFLIIFNYVSWIECIKCFSVFISESSLWQYLIDFLSNQIGLFFKIKSD